MDKQREKHIKEMNRVKEAIQKTDSLYLKNDYTLYYLRLKKELNLYDNYKEKI